jgi:hypothetical protein
MWPSGSTWPRARWVVAVAVYLAGGAWVSAADDISVPLVSVVL